LRGMGRVQAQRARRVFRTRTIPPTNERRLFRFWYDSHDPSLWVAGSDFLDGPEVIARYSPNQLKVWRNGRARVVKARSMRSINVRSLKPWLLINRHAMIWFLYYRAALLVRGLAVTISTQKLQNITRLGLCMTEQQSRYLEIFIKDFSGLDIGRSCPAAELFSNGDVVRGALDRADY